MHFIACIDILELCCLLRFSEFEGLRKVNRMLHSTSSKHLWKERAKILRLKSLKATFETSTISLISSEAQLAYQELNKFMQLAIVFGKVEHVGWLVEGILQAEDMLESPFPFLTHRVKIKDTSDFTVAYKSWLFFGIAEGSSEEGTGMILPLLLNLKNDVDVRHVLLCQDYDGSGSNCMHMCAQHGKCKFLNFMLKKAREVGIIDDVLLNLNMYNETCLFLAFRFRQFEAVEEILKYASLSNVLAPLLMLETNLGQNCYSEAEFAMGLSSKWMDAFLEAAVEAGVLSEVLSRKAKKGGGRFSFVDALAVDNERLRKTLM